MCPVGILDEYVTITSQEFVGNFFKSVWVGGGGGGTSIERHALDPHEAISIFFSIYKITLINMLTLCGQLDYVIMQHKSLKGGGRSPSPWPYTYVEKNPASTYIQATTQQASMQHAFTSMDMDTSCVWML